QNAFSTISNAVWRLSAEPSAHCSHSPASAQRSECRNSAFPGSESTTHSRLLASLRDGSTHALVRRILLLGVGLRAVNQLSFRSVESSSHAGHSLFWTSQRWHP